MLRRKLVLISALGILFFGLGVGGGAFLLVKGSLEQGLEAQGQAQAARTAILLEEDLLLNDLYAVFRKLEELSSEGVLGFVLDPKGEVVVHTFPGGFPVGLKQWKGRFRFKGQPYRLFRYPIAEGELGLLGLALPEAPLWNSLLRFAVLGFWLALGIGGLAFALVSRSTRTFLRPLENTVAAVRAWERGEAKPLPQVGGELGVLVKALGDYRQAVARREAELSLLNQVAEAVNQGSTPEEVLRQALEALAQSGFFHCGEAWLGEREVARALCPYPEGRACPLRRTGSGYHLLEFPGARLVLASEAPRAFLEAIRAPVEAGLHRARYAEALKERAEERSRLLQALLEAQEAERARIARDLHDHVGQILTGIDLGLKAVKEGRLEAIPALQELVRSAIQDIRLLSRSLRPSALDTLGLEAALKRMAEEFAERTGIQVNLFCHLPERLPEAHETALYRVIQEALTNVARHAGAREVSVILQQDEDEVSLVVEDDGRGFTQGARPGLGLLGMRERVELLGGQFQVESLEDLGTTLYARIPLREVKT